MALFGIGCDSGEGPSSERKEVEENYKPALNFSAKGKVMVDGQEQVMKVMVDGQEQERVFFVDIQSPLKSDDDTVVLVAADQSQYSWSSTKAIRWVTGKTDVMGGVYCHKMEKGEKVDKTDEEKSSAIHPRGALALVKSGGEVESLSSVAVGDMNFSVSKLVQENGSPTELELLSGETTITLSGFGEGTPSSLGHSLGQYAGRVKEFTKDGYCEELAKKQAEEAVKTKDKEEAVKTKDKEEAVKTKDKEEAVKTKDKGTPPGGDDSTSPPDTDTTPPAGDGDGEGGSA